MIAFMLCVLLYIVDKVTYIVVNMVVAKEWSSAERIQ